MATDLQSSTESRDLNVSGASGNSRITAQEFEELIQVHDQVLVACKPQELDPLLCMLENNRFQGKTRQFQVGTIIHDKPQAERLDLCKQRLGPSNTEMLMKALHDNDVLNGVLLGANGMGDRGAKAVAELVANNSNIETVFLGCNMIREEGIEALTRVLHNNMHVRSLWVKRNPLELIGAQNMATMLRNNNYLRTLDLVQTRIDEEGTKVIIDALIDGNKSLQRLYLGGLGLTSNFAVEINRLLEGAEHVTDLFLSSNKFGDNGVEIMAEGIKASKTLRVLSLDSNGITHEGLEPLMEAVWNHESLQRLSLGFAANTKPVGASPNNFGDEGAVHVANMLKFNKSLHTLILENTKIGNEGAIKIAEALRKSNKTLVNLRLRRNRIDRPTKNRVKRSLAGRQPKKLEPLGTDLDTASIQSFYRNPKTTSFCPTLVVKKIEDEEDDFEVLDRMDFGCNADSDSSEDDESTPADTNEGSQQ